MDRSSAAPTGLEGSFTAVNLGFQVQQPLSVDAQPAVLKVADEPGQHPSVSIVGLEFGIQRVAARALGVGEHGSGLCVSGFQLVLLALGREPQPRDAKGAISWMWAGSVCQPP